MSNFKRVENIEEAYFRLHGIRLEVYFDIISHTEKDVKLLLNGKEVLMHQKYTHNKPTQVELVMDDNIKTFDSVYNAELEINDYLRSVL